LTGQIAGATIEVKRAAMRIVLSKGAEKGAREMLPAYIIDDLLEQERRRSELAIRIADRPEIEPPRPGSEEGEATSERGVAVIDFTI
jgi:hypothetical protein